MLGFPLVVLFIAVIFMLYYTLRICTYERVVDFFRMFRGLFTKAMTSHIDLEMAPTTLLSQYPA